MSKVVALATIALKPQPSVVGALEQLLEEAKAGRIQHLVAVFSDGAALPVDTYVGSGEPGHVLALVGGMELCKQTMLMSQFQSSAEYSG